MSFDNTERILGWLNSFSSVTSMPLIFINKDRSKILKSNLVDDTCKISLETLIEKDESVYCSLKNCVIYNDNISLPLKSGNVLFGYLIACYKEKEKQQDCIEILRNITEIMVQFFHNESEIESLSEELVEKYEEINLLYKLSKTLASVFDEKAIGDLAIEMAVDILGASRASILLFDEADNHLKLLSATGISDKQQSEIKVPIGKGVCGQVYETGKPMFIEDVKDVDHCPSVYPEKYRSKSFISVPITLYHETDIPESEKYILGVMNMTDKKGDESFTAGDMKLLMAITAEIALAIENCRMIEKLRQGEKIKREMEIAKQIQQSFFPDSSVKDLGFDISGACLPAANVGGDYYDYFFSCDDFLNIVIADISGHSISSALLMGMFRALIQRESLDCKIPSEILREVNKSMFRDLSKAELFTSVFYLGLDITTKKLKYSNAGHNPVFLWKRKDQSIIPLDTEGMLLGILEDVNYEEKELFVEEGDIIVLYTDGIIEAEDLEGNMFGSEKLQGIIKDNSEFGAQEILNKLLQSLMDYTGRKEAYRDDVTLVVMKV